MKSLIFIVTYNAETHLEGVFRRIPYERLPEGCEILVIDDASPDGTFEVGQKAALSCPIPTRVLKNPKNLGYGGNQKLGYEIAIEEGFDAVVLLHGDGQYAPELLDAMLAPILVEGVDVVLGSRMLKKQDALAGGMPFYKWIGNQVLTWVENRMLGAQLSEFHTGYRAYRVGANSGSSRLRPVLERVSYSMLGLRRTLNKLSSTCERVSACNSIFVNGIVTISLQQSPM